MASSGSSLRPFTACRPSGAGRGRCRSISNVGSARFAAVGPATARAIRRNGARVDVTADPHSAEGLIVHLAYRLEAGSTVLYPRAAGARPILADGLRRLGARITEAVGTRPGRPSSPNFRPSSKGASTASCSAVLRRSVPYSASRADRTDADRVHRVTTADAVRAAGLCAEIVPPRATAAALARAVIDAFLPTRRPRWRSRTSRRPRDERLSGAAAPQAARLRGGARSGARDRVSADDLVQPIFVVEDPAAAGPSRRCRASNAIRWIRWTVRSIASHRPASGRFLCSGFRLTKTAPERRPRSLMASSPRPCAGSRRGIPACW